MDWSNESYVKLFVRESADELRMGWQAWALFQKILRHSDRSGILDHEGDDDIPVLAAMARMDADIVRVALAKILKTGSVEQRPGHLFVVNKLDASEASKSNALRQKEKRQKRAVEGNRPKSDTIRVAQTQSVSQTTQRDTARHSATTLAEQSRAEQSRAEQSTHEAARMSVHAGQQLGADVCRWLSSHLGKRFNAASEVVTDAGEDWRSRQWDKGRVIGAVKLRVAQLKSIQPNRPDLTPALLFDDKLVKWVEQFDSGGTVGDYQTGKNGLPQQERKWRTPDECT